ncbi:MAG: ABC transporter permease [Caldilineaceae bacterium]|nr:ABC transporter permease [Caldilineaceae bacterium]
MSVKSVSVQSSKMAHLAAEGQLRRKPQTYWSMAAHEPPTYIRLLLALGFIAVIALLAILAGPISNGLLGVGPNQTNPANSFQSPYIGPYIKWQLGLDPMTAPLMLGKSGGIPHWLGTDQLGRDQLARLLYGGRVSLTIALAAATISLVLGVTVGTIAGFFGGVVDDLIMWVINTVVSIPGIYLLIIVSAIFKPNPLTLTLFLGFLGWFGTARFMRGNVFKVKELDYSLAARSLGARNGRIMVHHLLPNSIPVIIVVTAIDVGALILVESALSFLGLGIQPPTATWGSMLNRANNFVFLRDPATGDMMALHLLIWPGLLITLTVLAFYLIGDGLRDALDPMLKNKK